MRRALIVGIDKYPSNSLSGCENDAAAISDILETNGDCSPNFEIEVLTSKNQVITTVLLHEAIARLFTGDAETVLLFFAGHGIINTDTNAGYIVSQDGQKGAWGVALSDVITQANAAYPRIKSTVIILDSCRSGYAGEIQTLGNSQLSAIGVGVTILTACDRDQLAAEAGGHGLFTGLLLEGLRGTSADVCGRITPASVYSLIDQTLGAWSQRPIYKANVKNFVTLREVAPKIPLEVLRRLPNYFPSAAFILPLDPSFEPDRDNIPQELRHIPVNHNNARIFKELQAYNRHGLVVPVDSEHMYYAAINSKGCKLTALGVHYRKLAETRRL